MNPVFQAAIALGANLGDRAANIAAAIDRIGALDRSELLAVSTIIETEPVGPQDQPRFLNTCCLLETALSARDLLDALQAVERDLGRDRDRERRWGPRLIDLDLLLFDELVIDEPGLTIPHPRMHERAFVLQPLAAIAPQWVHPVLHETVAALWDRLRTGSVPVPGANLLT